jgi:predicted nucleic acid-binding protein
VILIDTNIVSEFMKPLPEPAVERWFLLNEDQCWIASVTIAEIAFGITKLDPGAKRSRLEAQLSEFRVMFANRTHGFGGDTAMLYGEVMGHARRSGTPMAIPDGQIAAIALERGAALATRNVKDFTSTALELINPWD